MLRKLVLTIAVTGIMAGAAHAGINAGTGINGSFHDMNAVIGPQQDDVLKRTCVFCHTPHNATTTSSGPLWNRGDVASYGAYVWATPANKGITFNQDDPLIGPSRLCMSCHDGTIAYDSHGSNGSMPGGIVMGGTTETSSRLVNDLTVTHPIGFKYGDALVRNTAISTELVMPTERFISTASANLGAGFNTNSRGDMGTTGAVINDTLYQGYMTCATCHEVHNTNNVSSDTGKTYNLFLRAREENSAICLSCHVK